MTLKNLEYNAYNALTFIVLLCYFLVLFEAYYHVITVLFYCMDMHGIFYFFFFKERKYLKQHEVE